MVERYDPKCRETAEHFLPSTASERLKAELAQHIQDAVEDWLVSERDRLAASTGRALAMKMRDGFRKIVSGWVGDVTDCDICNAKLNDEFVDGRTSSGPWAMMCIPCFLKEGVNLGQGSGQRYTKQANGHWLKTAG